MALWFSVSVIEHPLRLNDGSITWRHAWDFKCPIICLNIIIDVYLYFISPMCLNDQFIVQLGLIS